MNSKVEKINEYLIANQLVANGRDIEGDPYNTMLVSVSSVHGLGFYIFAGDDPIVGCKCVLATEIDPLTPGLLLLLNKLSGQYKTHSYIVDEDGILCAKFAMFFEDDKFDAENLFGYCSLVDYHVAKDIPEIFALLGREMMFSRKRLQLRSLLLNVRKEFILILRLLRFPRNLQARQSLRVLLFLKMIAR